jgi:hypothetical protein
MSGFGLLVLFIIALVDYLGNRLLAYAKRKRSVSWELGVVQ